jgi:hypothetical protein
MNAAWIISAAALCCGAAVAVGVLGIELIGTPPERLTAHMKSEIARWVKVARAANIKLE